MATQARTVTVKVTTFWHEEDDSETTTYAFSTTATKDEAIELAEEEAADLDASEFDFDATESCVTNVEEI